MHSIKTFLEVKLKLQINEEKSQVVHVSQASFLGFTFKGTKIRWTDKAFNEFIRRIKLYTGRSWFVSTEDTSSTSHIHRFKWEGLLEVFQNIRNSGRNDQSVVGNSRFDFRKRVMGKHSLSN